MLKRIYIDNFRCLVDFDLSLDEINLFLGPNGSGKSTVFDVLRKIQAFISGGTLSDIFEQLIRPGRDPREDLPPPILRNDVLTMEDLKPGMQLKGTVRNVVDFGAFIDIGVKQDGLLHISKTPYDTVLSVGDIVNVVILTVEIKRGRIGLGWPGFSGRERRRRR